MDQLRARSARANEPLDGEVADSVADDAPGGEEHVCGLQRDARVRRALDRLPVRQRAAIVLCYYEERSQAEAATLLGVSEAALESLLSRGRATLRKWLQDD
jgi:RNA polymerase sigma-70 factor (ECF subfamily)